MLQDTQIEYTHKDRNLTNIYIGAYRCTYAYMHTDIHTTHVHTHIHTFKQQVTYEN